MRYVMHWFHILCINVCIIAEEYRWPHRRCLLYRMYFYSWASKVLEINLSPVTTIKASISTGRVSLIDLDYYSITEHITENDLAFYPHLEFSSREFRIDYSIYSKFRIHNSIASIPVVPSATSTDRIIEDVGHRSWFFECREARIAFKTEYDSLKQITDTHWINQLLKSMISVRADLQIHDFCC